jgi:hypothetical protein
MIKQLAIQSAANTLAIQSAANTLAIQLAANTLAIELDQTANSNTHNTGLITTHTTYWL